MLRTAPLAVLLAPYAASAATLNVCATCTYTTIGAGVTAAVAGDTVLVAPGTYTDTPNRGVSTPRPLYPLILLH